jgi:hypothetical protein
VWHTLTQPEPALAALSCAIAFARGPTTSPRPLSPSTVAVLALSRTMRRFGRGLMRPSSSMSTYVCSRATPWLSMPRRSAAASTLAACAASARGTP